jgi:hypothetical protein
VGALLLCLLLLLLLLLLIALLIRGSACSSTGRVQAWLVRSRE